MKRLLTEYTVRHPKIRVPLELAIVADMHSREYRSELHRMRRMDAILIVGDLVNRHQADDYRLALDFLREAPDCAPTFYAIGNHERRFPAYDDYWPQVEQSRVRVLDNTFVHFGGIVLGGLSSRAPGEVDAGVVKAMAEEDGFRLLMCHHPEYYAPYVKGKGIDLTVAGHAHGGQIQVFGHGIYAPGQWFLPRLTDGFYDDRHLLVSRGMNSSNRYPRWGNPCELVILHLLPEEKR